MGIQIRKAKFEELPLLLEIYTHAKHFMEEHGNRNQWSGKDAITYEKLEALIEEETLYVGEEEGRIEFSFFYRQGQDPTYKKIVDGAWLNDEYYGTIHRLASAGRAKGVLKMVSDWALEQNPNVRIDTHHDNYVMQNALAKAGFSRCGIIFLANGDPRIAYQKVKSENK